MSGAGSVGGGMMQGITGLVNAGIGERASIDASNAQRHATEQGLGRLSELYGQTAHSYQPYTEAGQNALSQLSTGLAPGGDLSRNFTMADFHKDPSYDFNLQQGLNAINNSASVRGGALSGGTLKALEGYGQGMANNEYQNAYNRFTQKQNQNYNQLSGLAGMGLNATNSLGAQTAHYGDQYLGGQERIGDVNAAGIMGEAKSRIGGYTALGQGIGTMLNGIGQ